MRSELIQQAKNKSDLLLDPLFIGFQNNQEFCFFIIQDSSRKIQPEIDKV